MTGLGDTKEEAYQMLKRNFETFKESNPLPRPGSNVPLQFVGTPQLVLVYNEDV
jgi:hypothetical protein